MEDTGWLTIQELTIYSTLTETWKNIRMKTPQYLTDKFQLDDQNLLNTVPIRLIMTKHSYTWHARTTWNKLDEDLRTCNSLPLFKKKVKRWIKDSRPQVAPADPDPPDLQVPDPPDPPDPPDLQVPDTTDPQIPQDPQDPQDAD